MDAKRCVRWAVMGTLWVGSASWAGTLPEGMTKVDLTVGQASSDELWYQTSTKVPYTMTPRSGEVFRDRQFDLSVTRGISENTELGLAIGFSSKQHIKADGTDAYANSGISFYTAKAKHSLLNSAETPVDLALAGEFRFANDVNDPWVFQSPNDRSHHLVLGMEVGRPLVWGVYGYLNPRFIYRTHARPTKIEGTAGFVVPIVERVTFSPYFHFIQTGEGTDCNHSPRNYDDFHTRAFRGDLSDRHSGPGAVLSYAWDEHVTVEGFTYMKTAGMNTDKSTTFGMNLSYVIF